MVTTMTMITPAGLALMVSAEVNATRDALNRAYETMNAGALRAADKIAEERARWERIASGDVTVREHAR